VIPWQSRLRSKLTLIAPNGGQFTATWQGNDIEFSKLIGEFNPPLYDGTITQDLGSKGKGFPLTLTFVGDTNDTDSMNFLEALKQRGPWSVIHPVYGQFLLQPVGPFYLKSDPTGSGNLTVVDGRWINVPADNSSKSVWELGAQTSAQIDQANASAAAQFQKAVNATDPQATAAAKTTLLATLAQFAGSTLYAIQKTAASVKATYTQVYNTLFSGIQAAVWDGVNIYQQVQAIMALPAVVEADLNVKIAAFNSFAKNVISVLNPNGDNDTSAVNSAASQELWLSAAVTGAVLSAITTSPSTRDQALQAINDINDLFAAVTNALDTVQTATAGNPADQQYFSNGLSYSDLARVVAMGIQYLLRLIFDLKIAKRFTIDRPRHPGEIVITEYAPNDSSEYDSLYDLFIASNKLIGDDIILLPAGREVVIYV
jgi:DNA circularisation protein N-terminus